MNKINSLIYSEKRLARVLFGVLVVGAFAFIFGPNIYAQFLRQDGSAGWGYGYGYGYGYGNGFDSGTRYGYKTSVNFSAADEYGYGWGYGYRASATNTTIGATTYQTVAAADMGTAVPTLFDVEGTVSAAGKLIAGDNVVFTTTNAAGTVQTLVPTGTEITKSTGGTFDAATLTTADKASSITESTLNAQAVLTGAVEFGVSGSTLYFSKPVTVRIPVSATNGTVVKLARSSDSGVTWSSTGITAASTDTCTNGIGSDPADEATVASGYVTMYVCRASYFASYTLGTGTSSSSSSSSGGGSASSNVCQEVTYSDFATTCFGGYQYRNVATKTPTNCTLTASQLEAARRVCPAGQPNIEAPAPEVSSDSSAFVALEKSLVKKVNSALAKKLKGRILLQVQSHGEAWYVNPVNNLKYYMGRPADAFALMRKLGLGVSNKDFDSYKGKAPARLAGRILLKVQDSGKAYYVNPLTLTLHYLGRPADAFTLMRQLGLGVSNDNVRSISVGEVK